MCPGLGIARRWVVFLMLWPDIIQFGRMWETSDVVSGITQFTTVGHIATKNTSWMSGPKGDREVVGG